MAETKLPPHRFQAFFPCLFVHMRASVDGVCGRRGTYQPDVLDLQVQFVTLDSMANVYKPLVKAPACREDPIMVHRISYCRWIRAWPSTLGATLAACTAVSTLPIQVKTGPPVTNRRPGARHLYRVHLSPDREREHDKQSVPPQVLMNLITARGLGLLSLGFRRAGGPEEARVAQFRFWS